MPQLPAATFDVSAPRLPYHSMIEERFGVSKSSWKALVEAVYPGAKSIDSVLMVLSYCKARKLDPFKKPVHIVPVYSAAANGMVDTVWPGISEQRTTAMRTGLYAGCDEAEFGPDRTETWTWRKDDRKADSEELTATITFPEWARMTLYRMVGGNRVAVVGPKVYWMETYATLSRWSPAPNEMWRKRPRGQIEKCAEAAALRRAFPEELGDEATADEMEGREVHFAPAIAETARPTLSAGFPEEQQRLEAPRTVTTGAPPDDSGQLDKARSAQAGGDGGHDPQTGEVIEGDPLVVNGIRYPNKTRANEARRKIKEAAKVAPTVEADKPTSDSATVVSTASAEETSSQARHKEQSNDGETFPGDRPAPTGARVAEPPEEERGVGPEYDEDDGDGGAEDLPGPLMTAMTMIPNCNSWDEITSTVLNPTAQTQDWKDAPQASKDVIRRAAFDQYVALAEDGTETKKIPDSYAIFSMWLDFGAESAAEIDALWPSFFAGAAYKMRDIDNKVTVKKRQDAIMAQVQKRKAELGG